MYGDMLDVLGQNLSQLKVRTRHLARLAGSRNILDREGLRFTGRNLDYRKLNVLTVARDGQVNLLVTLWLTRCSGCSQLRVVRVSESYLTRLIHLNFGRCILSRAKLTKSSGSTKST